MRAHGVNLPCALPLLAGGDAPHYDDDGADVAGSWPATADQVAVSNSERDSPH